MPRDGAELTQRWVDELHALGYRDSVTVACVDAVPVGQLDRERAVGEVLTRLAARRSGWNAADIRGEVEQLIARRNIVTDAAIRGELAEDLTARTLVRCVPLLDRSACPSTFARSPPGMFLTSRPTSPGVSPRAPTRRLTPLIRLATTRSSTSTRHNATSSSR